MPIYEYTCTHCGSNFEVLQKLADKPTKKCQQCGQETAIRLVSAAGFQLKGSGWYATDFKAPAKTDSTKTESKASANDTAKTATEDKKN